MRQAVVRELAAKAAATPRPLIDQWCGCSVTAPATHHR